MDELEAPLLTPDPERQPPLVALLASAQRQRGKPLHLFGTDRLPRALRGLLLVVADADVVLFQREVGGPPAQIRVISGLVGALLTSAPRVAPLLAGVSISDVRRVFPESELTWEAPGGLDDWPFPSRQAEAQ